MGSGPTTRFRLRALERADTQSGLQIRQHRKHPAVVTLRDGQTELGEDVRYVLLHRALVDDQSLGDTSVRPALGHR
jgi:hypothetical protein